MTKHRGPADVHLKQIEALNQALVNCADSLSKDQIEDLRRLSVQVGIALVAAKNEPVVPKTKEMMRNFPSRLRSIMERLGVTQTEVAKGLGVAKQNVHFYVSGKTLPALDTFVELCRVLKTTPNFLIGWGVEAHQAAQLAEKALEMVEVE